MSIATEAIQDNKVWSSLGPIAKGGTVFGLAISPVPEVPRCWAATSCGIFVSDDQGKSWYQVLTGLSTPLLSTMVVTNTGALYAGSVEGDLFYSLDWGRTWEAGLKPTASEATITAIVASPNFRIEGTVFAATDGSGLLVTHSIGKQWEDSSFGLGSGNVLALASSPDWSRKETMFAATIEGVYISVNGGRAWRETELMTDDDDSVEVLAVSPAFERDHTVWAGTGSGKLHITRDSGRTWELLATFDGAINSLWLAPDWTESGRAVAGIGAQVFVTSDHGATWKVLNDLSGSVLALAGNDQFVLAGLYDGGIAQSFDAGQTWQSASDGLAARGFARLFAEEDKLYAFGPQEGLWVSSDAGASWNALTCLEGYLPITAVAISQQVILAASQMQGIVRSTDAGATWELTSDVAGIQALALAGAKGWAGSAEGKIWTTNDSGATWQEAATPCADQPILSIVASPDLAKDGTIYMASAIAAVGIKPARIALWRTSDGGVTWKQVTSQATTARWADIAMPQRLADKVGEQAVLATGGYCLRPLRRAKDVWISTQVDPNGANVLGLAAIGEVDLGGQLYAATGSGVFSSLDGGRTWQAFSEGLDGGSFVNILAQCQGEATTLLALSLGGTLWKRAI